MARTIDDLYLEAHEIECAIDNAAESDNGERWEELYTVLEDIHDEIDEYLTELPKGSI